MNRYGRPTTYKRITPDRGCGFILKRIYELTEASPHAANPRRQDVYFGTKWANRCSGFASLLWGSLVADRLIESDDGKITYQPHRGYFSWQHKPFEKLRAKGHYEAGSYTVRYHLTPKGRGVLFDMMDRVNAKNKTQPKLNTVGSVAEHDAKKDGSPVKASEWREDDFLLPGETKKEWVERNRVTLQEDGEQLAREFEKAFVEAADERDNLEPNAEKKNLNEHLKKIADRLEWLNDEISDIKNVLAEIIEQ